LSGRCKALSFSQDAAISKDEVSVLLAANAGGSSWVPGREGFWRRKDGLAEARIDALGLDMEICSRAWIDREKRLLGKKYDGF
jgi:hypothetical protein